MGVLVICVLVFTVFCIVCTVFVSNRLCIFILTFVCTGVSEDYGHRVKIQLQLVMMMMIIIIVIIIHEDINHNLQRRLSRLTALNKIIWNRGGTNPECQVARATNFGTVRLIFVGPQFGSCFKSPLEGLELQGGSYIYVPL